MRSALDFVHGLIPEEISVAVDATLGHGKDSLILAPRSQRLYAFEIQEEAYLKGKKLLSPYNAQVINDCHSKLAYYVQEEIDLVIFNLGYLPRGDKDICTLAPTSKKAILESFRLLRSGGRILIVAYGHEEGQKEIRMLEELDIDQKDGNVFRLVHYNGINNPPEAWIIIKK